MLTSHSAPNFDVVLVKSLVWLESISLFKLGRHLVLGLVRGQVPLHVVQEVEPPPTDDAGVRFHHRPAPKRKMQPNPVLRVHWHVPLKVGLRGEGALTLGTGNHLIG